MRDGAGPSEGLHARGRRKAPLRSGEEGRAEEPRGWALAWVSVGCRDFDFFLKAVSFHALDI